MDGKKLREFREAKGWSQPELARAAGVSQQLIDQIERGQIKRTKFLLEIAKALDVFPYQLDPTFVDLIPDPGQTAGPPLIVPGSDLVGARDLPIYAAAMGGEGHIIVTFDAIEYVKRPAVLEGVKNSYGLYVVGESMVPAYEPGDMALVHPHLPPARGKDVVLFHEAPEGEAEAVIKRLVGFNDREWTVQQFNPAEEFTLNRVEWAFCHRVVGKYSAR